MPRFNRPFSITAHSGDWAMLSAIILMFSGRPELTIRNLLVLTTI
jgi:hypothetical protein